MVFHFHNAPDDEFNEEIDFIFLYILIYTKYSRLLYLFLGNMNFGHFLVGQYWLGHYSNNFLEKLHVFKCMQLYFCIFLLQNGLMDTQNYLTTV